MAKALKMTPNTIEQPRTSPEVLETVKNAITDHEEELSGSFPTLQQLNSWCGGGLIRRINELFGGRRSLAKELGMEYSTQEQPKIPAGVLEKVKNTIIAHEKELDGRFPTIKQLRAWCGAGIIPKIQEYFGGLGGLAKELGLEPNTVEQPDTPKAVLEKVRTVIADHEEELNGYFPTTKQLKAWCGGGIMKKIWRLSGGLESLAKALGMTEKYLTGFQKRSFYGTTKGRAAETIIVNFLGRWAKIQDYKYSFNENLGSGYIEFVYWDSNRTKVGVDVTTDRDAENVAKKWTERDYRKHLDVLWVVVVCDAYDFEQYEEWDEDLRSRKIENVKVVDHKTFLNIFTPRISEERMCKLDAYAKCTIRNRAKVKKEYQQKKYDRVN